MNTTRRDFLKRCGGLAAILAAGRAPAYLLAARGASAARRIVPVEYLESTGTQLIDTGVRASSGFGFDISFSVTVRGGIDSATAFFCGYGSAWDRGIALCEDTASQRAGIMLQYGKNNVAASGIKSTVGTRYRAVATVNPYRFSVTGGGTSFSGAFTPGADFSGTNNFTLFHGCYGKSTTVLNPKGMRCYSFTLTDAGGSLVSDLVPVRVGAAGYMQDRVSGRLLGNAGTGSFILGPDL